MSLVEHEGSPIVRKRHRLTWTKVAQLTAEITKGTEVTIMQDTLVGVVCC